MIIYIPFVFLLLAWTHSPWWLYILGVLFVLELSLVNRNASRSRRR